MNCFCPRKVGHINGLFVLEDESGGCIFRCRKNQTNGRMACRVSRSLKQPAMAINRRDHDQRAEQRHYDQAGYCEYAPHARQASTKRRESNGSDVQ